MHAAAHRVGRISRQADNQIDLDLDAFVHHRPDASLESTQVVLAIHLGHRIRFNRLQAHFDFGEVCCAQERGRLRRDPFRAQLAEVAKSLAGISPAEQAQEVGEILALIQRRIEQHHFLGTAFPRVP